MEVGLYVHIPFCKSKCPYCDFFSITKKPQENLYLKALIEEVKLLKDFLSKKLNLNNIEIKTLYVGGGTPSLMSPSFYEKLMEFLSESFIFSPQEITLEANPESFTLEKAKGYKEIGFNRISLGIQSFQKRGLNLLQRIHSEEEIFKALNNLFLSNFQNFSLDLIYGWPGQGINLLKKDLQLLEKIQPPHVSFYELTIYSGTNFYKKYTHNPFFINEKKFFTLARLIKSFLKNLGYLHYEISNFAKTGYECQHNLLYWKVKPYLGIGAGAVSRIENLRFQNFKNLNLYYKYLLELKKLPSRTIEKLDNLAYVKEKIFMSLRLKEGFDLSELEAFGFTLKDSTLLLLKKEKLLDTEGRQIFLTEKGSFLHNQVVKFLWYNLVRI